LKQDVKSLGYGLSELQRLRPVTWHWKAELSGDVQLGLIAQEVEPLMPELVQHDGDAVQPLRLNYIGLMPVMIKAIQEQQAQIDQQRLQIDALKALVCSTHPDDRACK
jgi:hypothetical protein